MWRPLDICQSGSTSSCSTSCISSVMSVLNSSVMLSVHSVSFFSMLGRSFSSRMAFKFYKQKSALGDLVVNHVVVCDDLVLWVKIWSLERKCQVQVSVCHVLTPKALGMLPAALAHCIQRYLNVASTKKALRPTLTSLEEDEIPGKVLSQCQEEGRHSYQETWGPRLGTVCANQALKTYSEG